MGTVRLITPMNYSVPYNRYGRGMKFAEHNYQALKSSLGKGDYIFIQFGHNDEKTDESVYPGLGTYSGLDWSTLDTSEKDSQGRYQVQKHMRQIPQKKNDDTAFKAVTCYSSKHIIKWKFENNVLTLKISGFPWCYTY